MAIAQINLSESENQAIEALSLSAGKTSTEVLHEAVVQFLQQRQSEDRLSALQQARGIWQNRKDLPDFEELRKEWDRF